MKRFAIFITAALLFAACAAEAYAAAPETGASTSKKVMVYLKPDISVELNGARQIFRDANGQVVYPIIYNGTTYLPVRAASAIMKEPVEWESTNKTVYIGKTLSYPEKSAAPLLAGAAEDASESDIAVSSGLVSSLETAYLKSDILVMYDFEVQTFKDANGLTVYPLNYNGSTYLPIRAISSLMGESIVWDGAAKVISIGDEEEEEVAEEEEEDEDTEEEEDADVDDDEDATEATGAALKVLKSFYESEEALYYEASAKISNIKDADSEEKQAIAASASDNYLKAQTTTSEIKAIDTGTYTDSEKEQYEKLLAFAESNEYYLLVLENIAYMAASDTDYSMLADTFLYFALEAQTKMEEANDSIYSETV